MYNFLPILLTFSTEKARIVFGSAANLLSLQGKNETVMRKKLLIAALSSGSGKTTLTMGLLRALRNRGVKVQPFKCGPDYIDTKWHELACGQESVNLDPWMQGEHMASLLARYGCWADVCVTEGAMGLFDGYDLWHGSAAEVARANASDIVLVVNAKSAAYSVAALIVGAQQLLKDKFGMERGVCGVIFNNVGSESHFRFLEAACQDIGANCFGYLPKSQDIELPSRHLGLTIDERFRADALMERIAALVEAHIDLGRMMSGASAVGAAAETTAEIASELNATNTLQPNVPMSFPFFPDQHFSRIAIARDEAFNFTYRANIDSLREMSDELIFFSPMNDEVLPADTSLLYLPGGYPEFFIEKLSSNRSMMQSVREYAERGGYVFAECGGMLYLSESIVGIDGKRYPLSGVLPLEGTFEGMRLHLGYRQFAWEQTGVDGQTEQCSLRGHEFHYSDIRPTGSVDTFGQQTSAKGTAVATPVYRKQHVVASYTHFYWAH